jgi:hypothetical protein
MKRTGALSFCFAHRIVRKPLRTFLSDGLADRLRNLTTAAKDFGSLRDALTFVPDEDCPDRLSPLPTIFQAQLFYRER